MPTSPSVIDLEFPLQGGTIPADHAGALYGAIARVVPAIHENRCTGIHPIRGRLVAPRRIQVTPGSRLVVRLPAEQIHVLLPLAGETLSIGDGQVRIGIPRAVPLRAAPVLLSRLVVIKGFLEPVPFLEAASRQLEALGIDGIAALVPRRENGAREGRSAAPAGSPIRRTVRIHDREVAGFAVRVEGLTADDALRLQEAGLGGRRRFGCGIFCPVRANH